MIKYAGGKQRIGKEIATRIQEIERDLGLESLFYYEPFVGAGGIMMHMNTDLLATPSKGKKSRSRDSRRRSQDSRDSRSSDSQGYDSSSESQEYQGGRLRFGSDANPNTIAFMDAAANHGWRPPRDINEKEYNRLKYSTKPSALKGFNANAMSFGGQSESGWVGLYDRNKTSKQYVDAARKKIEKSAPFLEGVRFKHGDYRDFKMPRGGIIVMDPPYAASKANKPDKLFREFDNEAFWEYAEELAQENLVFVCEETAPRDWVVVWEKPYTRTTNQRKHTRKYTDKGEKAPIVKTTEKLFMYRHPPRPSVFAKSPIYPWKL